MARNAANAARVGLGGPSSGGGLWRRVLARREYALAMVIAVIVVAVTIRNPIFLSSGNVWDLLTNATQPAVVACGVMLVIVTGEIDISVGASMALLTALFGWLVSPAHWGWPPFLVIPVIILLGAAIGAINGMLVTLVRVPSIIVTLAMMTLLRGSSVLLMKPGDITDVPDAARYFGIGHFPGPVPVSLWVTAAVIAVTAVMIRFTPVGRRIFAVGSNPHAAAMSGLSITRIKLFVFTLTGFFVGIATLLNQSANINSGLYSGFELLVVTCVVVGGVSISGGSGSLWGVMLGVALLTMQRPVLVFLNLGTNAAYWEKAIQGGLILVAVLVDHFAARRAAPAGGHA